MSHSHNKRKHSGLLGELPGGRRRNFRLMIQDFSLSPLAGWQDAHCLLLELIQRDKLKDARRLLDKEANVNFAPSRDCLQKTLYMAIEGGHIDLARDMIIKGGVELDIHYSINKDTLLHVAVLSEDLSIIRLLLECGANVCLKDSRHKTPIELINNHSNENLVIFKLLMDYGAIGDESLIKRVVYHDNDKLLYYLLAHGGVDAGTFPLGTLLHIAAGRFSIKSMEILLNFGAQVDDRDSDGRTVLHVIMIKRLFHDKMVELLINHGANIYALDRNNRTPLHLAIENGNAYNVEVLLRHGVEKSKKLPDGSTPLEYAPKMGTYKIGRQLEGNYEEKSCYQQALRDAICHQDCDREIVNMLIAHGVLFDHEYIGDVELLFKSIEGGFVESSKSLLEIGANANSIYKSRSLLNVAIKSGHAPSVKILLEHGATVEYQEYDENLSTSSSSSSSSSAAVMPYSNHLEYALSLLKIDAMKVILEHGFNVNTMDVRGETALHHASQEDVAKILLKYGASVDVRNFKGETPLFGAVRSGDYELVLVLIEHGADVNLASYGQEMVRPIHLAIREGNITATALLLKYGARVNEPLGVDRKAPVHLAIQDFPVDNSDYGCDGEREGEDEDVDVCEIESECFIEMLLEYDCDLNLQDIDGKTALHYAIEIGQMNVVRTLLTCGADVDIATVDGLTPLDMALVHDENKNFRLHDNSDNDNECEKIIIRHLIRLHQAGLHVGDKNLNALRGKYPSIHKHESIMGPELVEYFIKCEEELAKIKNQKLVNFIILWDILRTKTTDYVENESLLGALELINFDNFGEYGGFIVHKIARDKWRHKLLQISLKSFHGLLQLAAYKQPPCCLPQQLVGMIFCYLDTSDLKNLNLCFNKLKHHLS